MELNNNRFNVEDNNLEENTVYGLAHTYSLIEKKIEEYLKPFGLGISKFNFLMVIKHKGQDTGMSQVEISEHLVVTPSNVAKLLVKLENEGLIERSVQKDRRFNYVKITKEGSNILDQIWPGYKSVIQEITGLLTHKELQELYGLSTKWYSKLEACRNS